MRHCLCLDLKDEPSLIAEYEQWHRNVWPEILESIKGSGINSMDIYRAGNRLFMIVEASDDFTFEGKAAMDQRNPKVQEWEQLMWKFQQPLPFASPGQKWVPMNLIFSFR
jgi:L-rhamnose mutarotase